MIYSSIGYRITNVMRRKQMQYSIIWIYCTLCIAHCSRVVRGLAEEKGENNSPSDLFGHHRGSGWSRRWQPTPVFLPGNLWTEEPGGLQSTGLQRVGRNWAHACVCTHTHTYIHTHEGSGKEWVILSWNRENPLKGGCVWLKPKGKKEGHPLGRMWHGGSVGLMAWWWLWRRARSPTGMWSKATNEAMRKGWDLEGLWNNLASRSLHWNVFYVAVHT